MNANQALDYLIQHEELNPPSWIFTQPEEVTLERLMLEGPVEDLQANDNQYYLQRINQAGTPREAAEILMDWILDAGQAVDRAATPGRSEPD